MPKRQLLAICGSVISLSGINFSNWIQNTPLQVETVFPDGSSTWSAGCYTTVVDCMGYGTVTTSGGSEFIFRDEIINVTKSTFLLSRSVKVNVIGKEVGFSTRFSLFAPETLSQSRRQFFIPGIVYQNISALPPGAIAGDPNAEYILAREDRMPLPFVSIFYPDDNVSSRLAHMHPNGTTIPNEDLTARIINADMQFGSLGFINSSPDGANLSLAFQYPGSEGDRTYVYNGGWANRSHPITPSISHNYSLEVQVVQGASASYYEVVKQNWRDVWDKFAPIIPPAPSSELLYNISIDLFSTYGVLYNGVPSMPFESRLPDGVVIDFSSQAGFVGRALPSAALLLFDAVVISPNLTRSKQAEAIVDLWAINAVTTCGVIKTWYDITQQGTITWRSSPPAYQGSIRIMSDGMSGMLDAWKIMPNKTQWLDAIRSYADFLLNHQAADGSILGAWSWTCIPLSSDTRQTAFIIPFLTSLFAATNDQRYYNAAIAAGTYAALLFNKTFSYEGGAVDNPDVPDKESGWLTTQAFIALYEMTANDVWLNPAEQSATYSETFIYGWNIPIDCIQDSVVYPCTRSTLGASLIATGQSGNDNYMAISWYDYKRLGTWLNDDHFLNLSAFLASATTQVVDWDGSLGYAKKGLMTEAVTFSVRRGSGVKDWLPWLTANLVHPIVQKLRDNKTFE